MKTLEKTQEDGIYYTDENGNVIAQITNSGFDFIPSEVSEVADNVRNVGDNVSEIITLKNQLVELRENIKDSVDSLVSLKLETGGEIVVSIPGGSVNQTNVALRLALHYGQQAGDVFI